MDVRALAGYRRRPLGASEGGFDLTRRELVQRLIFGSAAIAVVLGVFIADAAMASWAAPQEGFGARLLRQGSTVILVSALVFLAGAMEFAAILRAEGAQPHTRFACFIVTLLVISPWMIAASAPSDPPAVRLLLRMESILVLALAGTSLLTVAHRQTDNVLRDTAATWMIILYAGFLGSFATRLRCSPGLPVNEGLWMLLLVVLLAKVTDIGALFIGSAWGRHKLITRISPAKSVEGAVGGLLASIVLVLVLVGIGTALGPKSTETADAGWGLIGALQTLAGDSLAGGLAWGALLGGVVSAFAQLGDLLESSFKRDVGAKDSGKVLPQLGGVLDLVDSLVLALPVAWLLLTLAGIVA